jgi:hypothetical protein
MKFGFMECGVVAFGVRVVEKKIISTFEAKYQDLRLPG